MHSESCREHRYYSILWSVHFSKGLTPAPPVPIPRLETQRSTWTGWEGRKREIAPSNPPQLLPSSCHSSPKPLADDLGILAARNGNRQAGKVRVQVLPSPPCLPWVALSSPEKAQGQRLCALSRLRRESTSCRHPTVTSLPKKIRYSGQTPRSMNARNFCILNTGT
jgi:hypothetical protein